MQRQNYLRLCCGKPKKVCPPLPALSEFTVLVGAWPIMPMFNQASSSVARTSGSTQYTDRAERAREKSPGSGLVKLTLLALVATAALSAPARAANITATITWTGAIYGNSTVISTTITYDPLAYAFSTGSLLGHEYWYAASSFTTSGVSVSGSSVATDNGTYPQSAYDWFLVASDTTAELAYTHPGALSILLLPNGSVVGAPSNLGFGGMITPGGQQTHFTGAILSAVPESSTWSMFAAGAALLALRRRRSA